MVSKTYEYSCYVECHWRARRVDVFKRNNKEMQEKEKRSLGERLWAQREESFDVRKEKIDIFFSKWRSRKNCRFSHCRLICKDVATIFPAHKVVLCSASDVFKAMFNHQDLSEARTSVVEIEDTDSGTMEAFLRFLYTGELDFPASLDNAERLLSVAEKYDVKSLKSWCEEGISRLTDASNAVRVVGMADRYRADALRSFMVRFVGRNFWSIVPHLGELGDLPMDVLREAASLKRS